MSEQEKRCRAKRESSTLLVDIRRFLQERNSYTPCEPGECVECDLRRSIIAVMHCGTINKPYMRPVVEQITDVMIISLHGLKPYKCPSQGSLPSKNANG